MIPKLLFNDLLSIHNLKQYYLHYFICKMYINNVLRYNRNCVDLRFFTALY